SSGYVWIAKLRVFTHVCQCSRFNLLSVITLVRRSVVSYSVGLSLAWPLPRPSVSTPLGAYSTRLRAFARPFVSLYILHISQYFLNIFPTKTARRTSMTPAHF